MINTLIRLGVEPTQAKRFAEPLALAMQQYNITTEPRKAAFLSHCILESSKFTRLEENLFYTTPGRILAVWPSRFKSVDDAKPFARNPQALSNRVYSSRNGNGDEASGDGWRFRGRGLFQLTGKANYARAAEACKRPYVLEPDLVAQPVDACLTAAWFWHQAGCNALIDAGRFDATTRAINGPAMLHNKERLAIYQDALVEVA